MPTIDNPTEKTLAELGLTSSSEIPALFASVREQFDRQLGAKTAKEPEYLAMHYAWLGRKSGVLGAITDNWLKTAPPALKPVVGQSLNELKRHIEAAWNRFVLLSKKPQQNPWPLGKRSIS